MSLNKVNYVHGQTIISAQNMNDIQDEIIRLGEKEAVQSDWLETNEDSLAYVKNRTHWIDWQEGELFNGVFEEDTDGTWIIAIENAKIPILKVNSKYQVTIEEKSFESTLVDITEFADMDGLNKGYALGNLAIIDSDLFLNNEEPFLLIMFDMTNITMGILMLLEEIPRATEGYRVRIFGQSGSVKKLDEIYMPESYDQAKNVLVNLVNQVDECQTDISNHNAYIGQLQSGILNVLKYTSQTLTEAQKTQARKNIGAIGIDEGMQADLSETDESSLAFVKGILRRDQIPSYIPILPETVPYVNNKIECFCGQWSFTSLYNRTAMISLLQIENINQLEAIEDDLCIQLDPQGQYYPLYCYHDFDGSYWIDENRTIMLLKMSNIYGIAVFGEEQPSFSSFMLAKASWTGVRGIIPLHSALLPHAAVKRSELDSFNLITLEDIDMICAKTAKVTFPQHSLSVKISYTDSQGVFHENEDLPGKSKTTYEVIKDTPIKLNGNYFNWTSFVLPVVSKYYTKISDSEIIPHRNFEIKYSDSAPV